jgi:hypothetical protein
VTELRPGETVALAAPIEPLEHQAMHGMIELAQCALLSVTPK